MKLLHTITLMLIAHINYAQKVFNNDAIGFSMAQPENWILAKEEQILENLKNNITLDSLTLLKLIEQNKGTIPVVSFYKYPIETTAGLIPTIKVNIRNNKTKNFDSFKKSIEISFGNIKNVFPDFTFIVKPNEQELNGRKCIYAKCIYTLIEKNSSEKVKLIVYAIPVNNQFYQITFIDSEKENNEVLFTQISKSISIL